MVALENGILENSLSLMWKSIYKVTSKLYNVSSLPTKSLGIIVDDYHIEFCTDNYYKLDLLVFVHVHDAVFNLLH